MFLDAVQEGFVTWDRKSFLPGLTFKQQIDGTFGLLVQGFVVIGNVGFKQVLDALTQTWHTIALTALLCDETNKAMSVNGFSATKLSAPALHASRRSYRV